VAQFHRLGHQVDNINARLDFVNRRHALTSFRILTHKAAAYQ
jgi:hypothetical protein